MLFFRGGADGGQGGRNLDGAVSPIELLPEMLDAVGKRVTVLVDSGFRRGSDMVKALALPGCTSVAALGTQYLHIAPCAVRRVPQSSLRDRPNLRLIDSEQAVAGE